ncbi:MAG TPA: hypothetical protein VKR59_07660 [Terriglobales bacterium]|nr:hypothetical protein [Terriglobales bacterium]
MLVLALAACSSKPADNGSNSANNTASSSSSSSSPSSSDSGGTSSSSSAPASSAPGSAPAASPSATPAAPAPPPPVVIPAGTMLTVRLGSAVGSKISSPGDTFRATLASDVTVEGNTVIPKGSLASGTVVDAKALGKFKGGALLELRLTSITINGSPTSIATAAVSRTEKGKGKRTAVMAGGGTAFGAIVGGLAGGGKGAAIGALAGGGAGTAGAAYTGNKEIVLPAESALSFKLTSSLTVQPSQ